MVTINKLNGNVFLWINDAKVVRFPVNLFALNNFSNWVALANSNVYTKITLEVGGVVKEFPIAPATN